MKSFDFHALIIENLMDPEQRAGYMKAALVVGEPAMIAIAIAYILEAIDLGIPMP